MDRVILLSEMCYVKNKRPIDNYFEFYIDHLNNNNIEYALIDSKETYDRNEDNLGEYNYAMIFNSERDSVAYLKLDKYGFEILLEKLECYIDDAEIKMKVDRKINIFDWLQIEYDNYNGDLEFDDFKDFVNCFFENTFHIDGCCSKEGFVGEDDFIGEFIPSIEIDYENKCFKIKIE